MSDEQRLDAKQCMTLLRWARQTLDMRLSKKKAPQWKTEDAALSRLAGAFVTLHRKANDSRAKLLRGCIGTFEADQPVASVVARMAVAAATTDPRFPPVPHDELDDLTIEISILSPRTEITPDQVQVGVHGLYVTRGGARGVLLPQVATEYGWDRETFLSQTCRKAGLDGDCWRDAGTRIEAFTAQVFGEEDFAAE